MSGYAEARREHFGLPDESSTVAATGAARPTRRARYVTTDQLEQVYRVRPDRGESPAGSKTSAEDFGPGCSGYQPGQAPAVLPRPLSGPAPVSDRVTYL